MYELGTYEEEAHKLVGRRAGDVVDLLVTVGQLGQIIGREAVKAGMPSESVHVVESNAGAIQVLLSLMGDASGNDMILIKGSRGLAMEEIVTALQRGGDL
jgi:UDP-N-acetylmuramoyl-tripeptide--D-alanyl-D-alanine ligase